MQTDGKLTADEFHQLRRILWAPHYRMNRFNNYVWHQLGFIRLMGIVLVISIMISLIWHKESEVKAVSCTALAVGIAMLIFLAKRAERLSSKRLAKLNRDMPASIDMDEVGVHILGEDGTVFSIPWHQFKGWRLAQSVAVLDRVQSSGFVPLLVGPEGAPESVAIRDLLARKLGAPDAWA